MKERILNGADALNCGDSVRQRVRVERAEEAEASFGAAILAASNFREGEE